MPEVREAEVISWTSKTVEEDETHIAELKAKLARHHRAVLKALRLAPKLENKLYAMEQLLEQKKKVVDATENKVIKNAQSKERERLERLANEEELLRLKKSFVVAPMNKKRASSDDIESDEEERQREKEKRHKKKKEARMKKPEAEKKEEVPVRVFAYKPTSKDELNRLLAWTTITESEAHYKFKYGMEALERKIARGEPVPNLIALARDVCNDAQAVLAAEASPPSSPESSPISSESEPEIQDQMSSLRLAR